MTNIKETIAISLVSKFDLINGSLGIDNETSIDGMWYMQRIVALTPYGENKKTTKKKPLKFYVGTDPIGADLNPTTVDNHRGNKVNVVREGIVWSVKIFSPR